MRHGSARTSRIRGTRGPTRPPPRYGQPMPRVIGDGLNRLGRKPGGANEPQAGGGGVLQACTRGGNTDSDPRESPRLRVGLFRAVGSGGAVGRGTDEKGLPWRGKVGQRRVLIKGQGSTVGRVPLCDAFRGRSWEALSGVTMRVCCRGCRALLVVGLGCRRCCEWAEQGCRAEVT